MKSLQKINRRASGGDVIYAVCFYMFNSFHSSKPHVMPYQVLVKAS